MALQTALVDEATPCAPEADQAALPETHTLTFTGSGKEYFRIWIVNLFLTCATLGIYSAWAKVRRLQYFDRNTELAGAVFDFAGDPKAILRGRVLAVILLAAWHYAFGFSLAFGVAVVLFLLASIPYMMRGALRFRLRNTRYRGLRFGFTGTPAYAYRCYMLPMLTIMLPTVLIAFKVDKVWVGIASLLYLLWPLMHGMTKEYQHSNLAYGDTGAAYDLKARRFYYPYFMAFLVMVLVVFATIVMFFAAAAMYKVFSHARLAPGDVLLPLLIGGAMVYLMFLFTGGYLHVRLTNMVWSNTRFPGMRIKADMELWPYLKLQMGNAVLTLLTLGLYRPFAVVRLYRYRLSCMHIESDGSFEHTVAAAASKTSANADGVADFLGVDLSW